MVKSNKQLTTAGAPAYVQTVFAFKGSRIYTTMKINKRRGISEMLAIIILLALTVIAGAFVYTVFFGRANTLTSSAAITIQNVEISGTTLTISVQNTGTQAISTLSITVNPNPPGGITYSPSFSAVAPGATTSAVGTSSGFVAGDSYVIIITASSVSGSTVTASTTVTAQ